MKKMIFLSLIILVFQTACSKGVFQGKYEIKDIIAGIDEDYEPDDQVVLTCKGFNMSEQQVRSFFKKAVFITGVDWHYSYSYLPCYVKGKVIKDGQEYEWKINGGITGYIIFPDGKSKWIADESQKDEPE